MADIEANIARCPDPVVAEAMINRIDTIRKQGNSIGGVVECIVRNVPAGLGSPVFDKLEAELAKVEWYCLSWRSTGHPSSIKINGGCSCRHLHLVFFPPQFL
jgi:hypothetical protein